MNEWEQMLADNLISARVGSVRKYASDHVKIIQNNLGFNSQSRMPIKFLSIKTGQLKKYTFS